MRYLINGLRESVVDGVFPMFIRAIPRVLPIVKRDMILGY